MTGTQRTAVLAGLAAMSVACEALVGITDRDAAPTDGGPDATAQVEAGPDSPGTSPGEDGTSPGVDAGADATSPPADGGEASDALDAQEGLDGYDGLGGFDAFDGAVADPDVPCAMQPPNLFCDDFDSVGSVGQDWMYSYIGGDAGLLQLDTTTYVSAPVSAQVVMTPQPGIVTEAQLGTTVGPIAGGVRLAFDYRLDVPTFSNFPQVCVAQLYLRKDSTPIQINFVVGSGGTSQLQAYLPDASAALDLTLPVPTLATWSRVAISFTEDGLVSVFEDGQSVGSENVGPGAAGLVDLIAGAAYLNPFGTETVTLELDNVVVRAQ